MSLESLMYQYWKSSPVLSELIPLSSLFIAPSPSSHEMPYVTIVAGLEKVILPTNQVHSPRWTSLKLELHHYSYTEGDEISRHIASLCDCARLETESFPKTILRLKNSLCRCESEIHWTFVNEFSAFRLGIVS
ncbi:MAG: hypothetical protein ACRC10_01320 [Thermoguttaceae bacterium]